ncbi:MAG TPA: succinate dehydrogenase, hydrophobic membrane anchor protein [Caulobacteraceae bacterium]|nr:succinate dehydrogenase, hydrophobic membrane anchor protein [Caulobacteraceae bacterium]
MTDFRTPLGRARGLGAAKHGVGHFIGQRVSAAGLVLLILWGVFSALTLAHTDYQGAVEWLRQPVNVAVLVLTAVAAFYHMQLGMRVIIEDYVHTKGAKTAALVANVFVVWGGCALTVVSLLKVAFGGGAQ